MTHTQTHNDAVSAQPVGIVTREEGDADEVPHTPYPHCERITPADVRRILDRIELSRSAGFHGPVEKITPGVCRFCKKPLPIKRVRLSEHFAYAVYQCNRAAGFWAQANQMHQDRLRAAAQAQTKKPEAPTYDRSDF